ncbi:MAG: hypothetical protein M3256_10110 [Actinomycetota bacterium]|nr:hypothetical protein [Actinomycetota bacterium]
MTAGRRHRDANNVSCPVHAPPVVEDPTPEASTRCVTGRWPLVVGPNELAMVIDEGFGRSGVGHKSPPVGATAAGRLAADRWCCPPPPSALALLSAEHRCTLGELHEYFLRRRDGTPSALGELAVWIFSMSLEALLPDRLPTLSLWCSARGGVLA